MPPPARFDALTFERLGILREITGQQRNRRYRYDPYLALFDRQALPKPEDGESDELLSTVAIEPARQKQ